VGGVGMRTPDSKIFQFTVLFNVVSSSFTLYLTSMKIIHLYSSFKTSHAQSATAVCGKALSPTNSYLPRLSLPSIHSRGIPWRRRRLFKHANRLDQPDSSVQPKRHTTLSLTPFSLLT
jgi:hypothetical protein